MSIAQRIQKISQNLPDKIEFLFGKVIETEPLKLEILNNSKRTPFGDSLIIPQHLSKYETTCDLSPKGTLTLTSGGVTATVPQGTLTTVTIDNTLKLNDVVICLYYDVWEQYYIMDKVVI